MCYDQIERAERNFLFEGNQVGHEGVVIFNADLGKSFFEIDEDRIPYIRYREVDRFPQVIGQHSLSAAGGTGIPYFDWLWNLLQKFTDALRSVILYYRFCID